MKSRTGWTEGLTRHEIAEILDSEYSFSVTAKGLDGTVERGKTEKMYYTIHMIRVARRVQRKVYCTIHTTLSLKRRKSEKAESPGIIDKEFFK